MNGATLVDPGMRLSNSSGIVAAILNVNIHIYGEDIKAPNKTDWTWIEWLSESQTLNECVLRDDIRWEL